MRLEDYFRLRSAIHIVSERVFMGELWNGEGVGFTEWLRPVEDPDATRMIFIDIRNFPDSVSEAVIADLRLPIAKGMKENEVFHLLGLPVKTFTFLSDRLTHVFLLGNDEKYYLDLTFHHQDGLTNFTLSNHPNIAAQYDV